MSSFRKRHVQKPIPGTRTSPQTGQIITSSGNPSFDVIVGGGLPVGSVCLIEEDKYVTFSKVLSKYFVAEGVVSGQSILLGSLDDDPKEMMLKLPKPLNDDEDDSERTPEKEDSPKNGLRIAWRYNDLPPVNSEQTPSKIGHNFNLMEYMDKNLLDFVDTLFWNGKADSNEDNGDNYDLKTENMSLENDFNLPSKEDIDQNTTSSSCGNNTSCKEVDSEQERMNAAATLQSRRTTIGIQSITSNTADIQHKSTTLNVDNNNIAPKKENESVQKIFTNAKYQRFLNLIQSFAKEEKFTTSTLVYRSLCRICITSLGSPLWYDEDFSKNILKFLTILKGIVRNSISVCFITMPMNLIAKCDATLVPKIRNLVDYAIELESFSGSEYGTNPGFKEYNGLIHLRKITAVNTLTAYIPETYDLAFKLRRKKFVIEKLHLPPDLEENDSENRNKFSCHANVPANTGSIDF
ncbi:putative elongator complex protein 4 [Ceratitis capitata]|uniref:Elongator complex protein 4 n=1 Tax=Ceratitis capitata TaxID=7213 RepID=W8CAF7_CERCA|nr:putative elongator complex protein 4 [Ceratitis capitata]XP_020716620.1 putative elongator complex protein 4 [Ceratitis capitata]CAD7013079.1 unnamed protein product [Ceratitis capitata]